MKLSISNLTSVEGRILFRILSTRGGEPRAGFNLLESFDNKKYKRVIQL